MPQPPTTPATPNRPPASAIVVGAGIAGLACAIQLHRAGVAVRVVEASDRVGGRVATDVVHGPGGEYLVDRGFQVYLTAYPEASALLDHRALNLRSFTPGAIVHTSEGERTIADPLRDPVGFFSSPLPMSGILKPSSSICCGDFSRGSPA